MANKNNTAHEKKRAIAMAHLKDLPPGVAATPQERGFAECPCPGKCTLHGSCLLCTAFHGRKGRQPYCEKNQSVSSDSPE